MNTKCDDVIISGVSCGDPGPVANAHYSGSYLYEDQVLYVCDDGFFFAGGDAILVCHGDRRWQGKRIVCEGKFF